MTSTKTRALSRVVLAALLVAGCQQLLGIEEGSEPGGGTGGTGATMGSGAAGAGGQTVQECPEDQRCLEIPNGWLGPIQMVPSDAPLSCGGRVQSTVLGGVNPTRPIPPASCNSCSCSALSGNCTATVTTFEDAACGTANKSGSGSDCVTLTVQSMNLETHAAMSSKLGTPGTCDVEGGGGTVPPVEFESRFQQCALEVGPACVGGTCLDTPAPTWLGPCIYIAGDVPCAEPFPDKVTMEATTSDDRSCTACSCAAPPSCLDASLMLFGGAGCTQGPQTLVEQPGVCEPVSLQEAASFFYRPACTPSGGQPVGEALVETTTVCCAG